MPLPEERHLTFVVCEELRQETGGKVSLLGVYGGEEILVIAPPGEAPILSGIGFYYCFGGGEGTFAARFELTDPHGTQVISNPVGQLVKRPDGALNVMVQLRPFPTAYGVYRARLYLDDRAYERTLRVTRRDPPPG